MPTLAKIRRCVYPFPVYEAHFDTGKRTFRKRSPVTRRVRMSFWSPANKPINASLGRVHFTKYDKGHGPLVNGFVEGGGVDRHQDPHFSPEAAQQAPRRRITAKQAKEALANLLHVIDGGHEPSDDWAAQAHQAVECARQLVAA